MASITLTDVSKRWGAVTGVQRLNLAIADAEFVVFLGPSAAARPQRCG